VGTIGLPELLLVLPLVVFFLPALFYHLTLRRALLVCAPESRTLSPDLVWLLFVPLFDLFWHFVVVVNVSRTFRNEFRRRAMSNPPDPAQTLGLAMCVLTISGVGILGAFLCWIFYWVRIARISRLLRAGVPPALDFRAPEGENFSS
jgi:hypothetical protein